MSVDYCRTAWQVTSTDQEELCEIPSWSMVSGEMPARYALAAVSRNSSGLRLIISTREWVMLDIATGTSISFELTWCRDLPASGMMLLCGSEIPGSTCVYYPFSATL
jgi:hypothetical protein